MKREELILVCRKCGATHLITPPKRKLKKATEIELKCYRCSYNNNYKFIYNVKMDFKLKLIN